MMLPQLLEFLIFGAIAFFLIQKLISVLGTTYSEEQERFKNSVFGEPSATIKDVTPTAQDFSGAKIQNIASYILDSNEQKIISALQEIKQKLPRFDAIHFLSSVKSVFVILAKDPSNIDMQAIETLVDKRFTTLFLNTSSKKYSHLQLALDLVEAKISDIYNFGNSIYIKVLFSDSSNFKEEWTFSKSYNSKDNAWLLNNIEE